MQDLTARSVEIASMSAAVDAEDQARAFLCAHLDYIRPKRQSISIWENCFYE